LCAKGGRERALDMATDSLKLKCCFDLNKNFPVYPTPGGIDLKYKELYEISKKNSKSF
jgi:hypothetical protein